MADEQRGRIIGHGPCPTCGAEAAYKLNKKNHVYVYCATEADGGCHSGSQSRSHTGDVAKARRIKKWTSPEDRKRLLGGEGDPERSGDKTVPWYERSIL